MIANAIKDFINLHYGWYLKSVAKLAQFSNNKSKVYISLIAREKSYYTYYIWLKIAMLSIFIVGSMFRCLFEC